MGILYTASHQLTEWYPVTKLTNFDNVAVDCHFYNAEGKVFPLVRLLRNVNI